MTEHEVRKRIREACKAAGSRAMWARQAGLSSSYVCDVTMGRRAPAGKLLVALGLRRKVTYEPIRKEK